MHRFFVDPARISANVVYFEDEQAHQIRRVLRLRPGDRVVALDGLGRQYDVALEEVSGRRVTGAVIGRETAAGEPHARLTLYLSLLRREKFEWALQKGTEIGAAAFVPVITRRSLLRDAEDVTPEKLTRWRRIIKEAAEQSGRGLLPELTPPVAFSAGLAAGIEESAGHALIAWEGNATRTIPETLAADARAVALFIGPEGGYDPAEIEEAAAAGALPVTLGRRILRAETAALVGATLVLHTLGEIG